ncbi:MAG: bacterial Ig-like domain-containing protein [Treponema sp.]|jgi:hypothetical protein|nr:bacterial Ig-like domain-containing protein [Treponema sp.]
MNMKRFKLLAITGAGLVLLAVLAGCASMTLVSIDKESGIEGPKQVRQYRDMDTREIKVYGNFKDGKRRQVSVNKNDIVFDNTKPGPQTVTVKLINDTISFETEVMPLTGMTIAPVKPWKRGVSYAKQLSPLEEAVYKVPFMNEWPGLEIQAEWDQMGSEKLSENAIGIECKFIDFDPNVAGSQTVVVAWKGKSASFNVEVVDVESIRITSNPAKTAYNKGEALDITGMIVIAAWPGLGEEEVKVGLPAIKGYNADTIGKQTLTVTYRTKTATFEVEVLSQ